MLVEDARQPRDGTPEAVFNAKIGYFCIAIETALQNCSLVDHPDKSCMSFKLSQVSCQTCQSDLGNLQTATAMNGDWSTQLGENVVHFKCASVLLELTDNDNKYLEPRKWSALKVLLGGFRMYRLSQLTMRRASELMRTTWSGSGKDVRFVARRR